MTSALPSLVPRRLRVLHRARGLTWSPSTWTVRMPSVRSVASPCCASCRSRSAASRGMVNVTRTEFHGSILVTTRSGPTRGGERGVEVSETDGKWSTEGSGSHGHQIGTCQRGRKASSQGRSRGQQGSYRHRGRRGHLVNKGAPGSRRDGRVKGSITQTGHNSTGRYDTAHP